MRTTARIKAAGVLAIGALLALCPYTARREQPARLPALIPTPGARPPVRGAFEQALRAAAWDRMEAKIAVNREREALDRWDPAACGDQPDGSGNPEAWRLRQLALDPSGKLCRARKFALRAQRMARGPDEAYRAAELRVLIEHESGHHDRELALAQRLMKLRPHSPRAWSVLRRARRCPALRPLGVGTVLPLISGERSPALK